MRTVINKLMPKIMKSEIESAVYSKLASYTKEICDHSHLGLDRPLGELQLDSLAVLEVVYELEEHFDITLESTDLGKLMTIGDLVIAVDRTISNAA